MKKQNTNFLFCIVIALIVAFCGSFCVLADNLESVEAIIAGKQDKLIFGTVVSIGDGVCTVEVMEEVGSDNAKDESDEQSDKNKSVLGKKIDVENFNSYMYYDGFDHKVRLGDNVLVSLSVDSNTYRVKNGAFLVSEATHDTFNFRVPDTIDGTDEAMQLTALYRFVVSNGKNADYTIKNSVVYTHDTAKGGVEVLIEEQEGIIFVNEEGETTKEAESVSAKTHNRDESDGQSRWILAAIILAFGVVSGLFIVKMTVKIEKKSDSR